MNVRRFRKGGEPLTVAGCAGAGRRGSVLAAASKVRLVPSRPSTCRRVRRLLLRRPLFCGRSQYSWVPLARCPWPRVSRPTSRAVPVGRRPNGRAGGGSGGTRRLSGVVSSSVYRRRDVFARASCSARPVGFFGAARRHRCGVRQRSQSLDQSTGKVIGGRLNSYRKRVITCAHIHTHTLTHATHSHIRTHSRSRSHTHTRTYVHEHTRIHVYTRARHTRANRNIRERRD